jgi:vancomycin resistance protein YoaR
MKVVIASAAALALMAGAAMAQSNANSTSSPQANQNAAAQAATAQKIKNDLTGAGFQDVNVVAESFLVQAKTKDGDPVVMTIGPHGMTMIETSAANSSSNSKSGSSSNTTSK